MKILLRSTDCLILVAMKFFCKETFWLILLHKTWANKTVRTFLSVLLKTKVIGLTSSTYLRWLHPTLQHVHPAIIFHLKPRVWMTVFSSYMSVPLKTCKCLLISIKSWMAVRRWPGGGMKVDWRNKQPVVNHKIIPLKAESRGKTCFILIKFPCRCP